jgi:hypothetical protein
VVALRYGPLGPSFREALRRVFSGVPRIYGFDSVAPRGEYSARQLALYFERKGDYRLYLERSGRSTAPNRELLDVMRDTDLVQISGVAPSKRAQADRAQVCSLYDETISLRDRLLTVQRLMQRTDFLAFLPSIEMFMRRHPVDTLTPSELAVLDKIRARTSARDQVVGLLRALDTCALKMELASLAVQLGWMDREEFRKLALQGTRQLLKEQVSTETVDIMCEISRHEKLGPAFKSADIAPAFFESAEGLRFVDCLAPTDHAVTDRIVPALDAAAVSTRMWAAYALSHRASLSAQQLLRAAQHLDDASPDVRQQLRWLVYSHAKSPSPSLRRLVERKDPSLASLLPEAPLAGGGARPQRATVNVTAAASAASASASAGPRVNVRPRR